MIGSRIKELRQNRGFSQAQLAELLSISPQTVDEYELGGIKPPAETLVILADLFGVSIDYLFGRETSKTPAEPSPEQQAAREVRQAVIDDPELYSFWRELEQKPDLQILLSQTKHLPPETIRKIIRIIKAMED